MLSRIAESLYWVGRYVERAEDTARILDVHFHLLLEDPGSRRRPPAGRCWTSWAWATASPRATGRTVTEILAFDEATRRRSSGR